MACHLGVCIAVRLTQAVPLINIILFPEIGSLKFSIPTLETALKMSGLGKRSKQRFLKSSSKDDFITPSKKGAGGNSVPYKCYIIKQSCFADEIVEQLRQGT